MSAEFWAARGQRVVFSPRVRAQFDAIADPRFQHWELEDVELARALGRETLPWTCHEGWFQMIVSDTRATLRDTRFAKRSDAAKRGWITRGARLPKK